VPSLNDSPQKSSPLPLISGVLLSVRVFSQHSLLETFLEQREPQSLYLYFLEFFSRSLQYRQISTSNALQFFIVFSRLARACSFFGTPPARGLFPPPDKFFSPFSLTNCSIAACFFSLIYLFFFPKTEPRRTLPFSSTPALYDTFFNALPDISPRIRKNPT